jgi:sodium transport system permease protein
MNLHNIITVYRKELRDSLRDRRTVISMIVVPIFLMPVLTILVGVLSARLIGRALQETPSVMIIGAENSPRIVAALRELPDVRLVPAAPDYTQQIVDKKIRAAVELPSDFDAIISRGGTASVRIDMYEGEMSSGFSVDKLQKFFRDFRDRTVRERLQAHSLPPTLSEPIHVEEENVAPPEKVSGVVLGGLVPYFVIILSLTGTMYPAMDLTVGEKERGTIETILCSPISRTSLVLGKFLMVLTASLATAALAIASMGLTFAAASRMVGGMRAISGTGLQFNVSPKAVIWVFVMVVPLAVLFSAALLAISLFAKSFKEAQSYLSPLTIVVIAPAIVSILPGVELNTGLSLVPILSTSLVSKEIVSGTYHWNYVALIFGSSCVYAAAALWTAVRLFQREDVLFRI